MIDKIFMLCALLVLCYSLSVILKKTKVTKKTEDLELMVDTNEYKIVQAGNFWAYKSFFNRKGDNDRNNEENWIFHAHSVRDNKRAVILSIIGLQELRAERKQRESLFGESTNV